MLPPPKYKDVVSSSMPPWYSSDRRELEGIGENAKGNGGGYHREFTFRTANPTSALGGGTEVRPQIQFPKKDLS